VEVVSSQLQAARENLRRLQALEEVHLIEGDTLARSSPELQLSPERPATVITNIPYGERLGGGEGKDEEIRELYRAFGDWLKKSDGVADAWILTGNLPASRSFGLRSSARIELYNGPIECRLLHFALY
jgi:putative N6-adenine-specific DNA methylase